MLRFYSWLERSTPPSAKQLIPESWRTWLGYQVKVKWQKPIEMKQFSAQQLTEQEQSRIKDLLQSFHLLSQTAGDKVEQNHYLQEAFYRFLYTWQLVPQGNGRLLEIGANPYYISLLLHRYSEYELHFTNYFGTFFAREDQQIMTNGEEEITFPFLNINVEEEPLPFDDGSFDVVMLCEVLEHFTNDPLLALLEIKRVLRPEGCFILTTPNVARLENVQTILDGQNIYDPYSRYGAYGRHNREYTLAELHQLLHHVGFTVEESFTADVHPFRTPIHRTTFASQLAKGRENALGQYCFIRAISTHAPNPTKPRWLYRNYDDS